MSVWPQQWCCLSGCLTENWNALNHDHYMIVSVTELVKVFNHQENVYRFIARRTYGTSGIREHGWHEARSTFQFWFTASNQRSYDTLSQPVYSHWCWWHIWYADSASRSRSNPQLYLAEWDVWAGCEDCLRAHFVFMMAVIGTYVFWKRLIYIAEV